MSITKHGRVLGRRNSLSDLGIINKLNNKMNEVQSTINTELKRELQAIDKKYLDIDEVRTLLIKEGKSGLTNDQVVQRTKSGEIDMKNNKIINLKVPMEKSDATNKGYCDNIFEVLREAMKQYCDGKVLELSNSLSLFLSLDDGITRRLLYMNIIYEYNPIVWFSYIDLSLPLNRTEKPKNYTFCLVNSDYQTIGVSQSDDGLKLRGTQKIKRYVVILLSEKTLPLY